MLDHTSIPVANLDRSARFYDAVLATLGYSRRKQSLNAVGYGPDSCLAPVFWILSADGNETARAGRGMHISFQAPSRDSVDAFHTTALSSGGINAGLPGERPQYTQPFYGGFVLDPDGFKIEAVCRR